MRLQGVNVLKLSHENDKSTLSDPISKGKRMANLSKQSQQEEYRELTIASLVLGVVIGAIMTCAFVHIGLKLGFTMGGSTVAAILGFAVLGGVMGKGSIIENNVNQTVASGVNNASVLSSRSPHCFYCPNRPSH